MNNSSTVFSWVWKTVVSDKLITAPLSGGSQVQQEASGDPKWCWGCHEWDKWFTCFKNNMWPLFLGHELITGLCSSGVCFHTALLEWVYMWNLSCPAPSCCAGKETKKGWCVRPKARLVKFVIHLRPKYLYTLLFVCFKTLFSADVWKIPIASGSDDVTQEVPCQPWVCAGCCQLGTF